MVGADDCCYLQYDLSDGQAIVLVFQNINDLDGCHISLDMYKANLGPVDVAIAERIASKFNGHPLSGV